MGNRVDIDEKKFEQYVLSMPETTQQLAGIAGEMKREAQAKVRSKTLRKTIWYTIDEDSGKAYLNVGKRGQAGFRAIYEEYGTVFNAPRPFVRPAVQKVIERYGGRWEHTYDGKWA